MALVPAPITTELMEQTDGRPVAYIDATAVAVFTYQQPDGTYMIDIYTRDDIPSGGLRVLLDESSLLGAPVRAQAGGSKRRVRKVSRRVAYLIDWT